MKDYGYKKALSQKTDKELISIIEVQKDHFHKNAILDAQNILFERGVSFNAAFPNEINLDAADAPLDFSGNSLWEYAWEKKKAGLSYSELLSELIHKGATSQQAVLTLRRLPRAGYISDSFATLLAKEYKKLTSTHLWLTIVLAAILLFIVWQAAAVHFAIIIGVTIGCIYSLVSIYFKTGHFSGSDFWISMIKDQPEHIVWIKPVVEKVTLAHVITLSKTKKFQLLTKHDRKLEITCETAAAGQVFIDAVKESLPHAHIGYSNSISILYSSNPEKFIENLKLKNLYTPIDMITFQ